WLLVPKLTGVKSGCSLLITKTRFIIQIFFCASTEKSMGAGFFLRFCYGFGIEANLPLAQILLFLFKLGLPLTLTSHNAYVKIEEKKIHLLTSADFML
ncbi:MAG: hypothetical protein NC828_04270, partial [Candidatus Omnitrophica bacterium]|nr:hypothetical protein [Candidatus Omnitrophota bacterium]